MANLTLLRARLQMERRIARNVADQHAKISEDAKRRERELEDMLQQFLTEDR